MTEIRDCIVVGAGIAGLSAAGVLKSRGASVLLLDKGRSVGGRMATRWIEEPDGVRAYFDHGAQFFTVRDDEFQRLVDGWIEAGIVREWCRGFDLEKEDGHPRYVGVAGMNSIARFLSRDHEVLTGATVSRVYRSSRTWHVELTDGKEFVAKAVIITAPLPQALSLLGELAAGISSEVGAIEYNPCLALLIRLTSPSALPSPGGLRLADEPISWIADNFQKGISPEVATVTVHASPAFSKANWNSDPEIVVRQLIEVASSYVGSGVRDWQLHKWRYSQSQTNYPFRFLDAGGGLYLAGDAFGSPRIEGAVLSGLSAGRAVRL